MGSKMRSGPLQRLAVAGFVLGSVACAAQVRLPPPRPLIVQSGARLRADAARLEIIDDWVRDEVDNIQRDPSFLIRTVPRDTPVWPWEGLEIVGDTANIGVEARSTDAATPYEIYAHLHLMAVMGHQERWLPEAPEATGYAFERAVIRRVSDAWLYGRSIFDAVPYEPLDELIYSTEAGFLDAFLFTARPGEFEEDRLAWVAENPVGLEAYREWFEATFQRLPPGLRPQLVTTPVADSAGVLPRDTVVVQR